MRIDSLLLTNFRNFREARLAPEAGVNIFFGDNGSGKTSLLEAIFTLCLGKSQRGARDEMMVGEGGDEIFRLEGKGEVEGRQIHLACAYQKGGRKKITIDGNPVRMSELYQLFSIISMAPDDVSLFAGSPGGRRRFLDLYLSQASPTYLADLSDYNRALAQKNAFLKNGGGGDCPFDPLLVAGGSRIMLSRRQFILFLSESAPRCYQQISADTPDAGRMILKIDYEPNVAFDAVSDIQRRFEQMLITEQRKEAVLETAVVGPHRDDLAFHIGQFPAKGYGSQGELRSAAIAVMIAAAEYLSAKRDERPVLLLDEIFAELDDRRRENLAILLGNNQQIFLTTATAPPKTLLDCGTIYHIESGTIRQG